MMRRINLLFKRVICAVLTLALIFTGMSFTKLKAVAATDTKTGASRTYVYYVKDDALFRVMGDGSNEQLILSDFSGEDIIPVGNYLYYMSDDEELPSFMRIAMDGSEEEPSIFTDDDIIYHDTDGTYIYYLNTEGELYRAPANAESTKAKLVTDKVDTRVPEFSIKNGQIYYNALKNGKTTWAASKAADGSGQIKWIAAGAFPGPWYMNKDNTNINTMIDSNPHDTKSTKSMVLYTNPLKGGAPKAINAKSPLDVNAVYTGKWVNGYYLYNKDIKYNSDEDEYDYKTGKGYVIDTKGKNIQIHTKGVIEIANVGTDKLVFIDSDYKAYVCTIKDGKAINKKAISIKDASWVYNLSKGGKLSSTIICSKSTSDSYIIKSDLTLQKLSGVDSKECIYADEEEGFFYVNSKDSGRLYYMSSDGKTTKKLSDEEDVYDIILLSKY